MRIALFLLLLAGCGKDVLAPDGMCLASICATASQLCTTPACASAPCTPGCVFQNPRDASCPTALPSTIAPKDVTRCAGLCGFVIPRYGAQTSNAPTSPGTCYHYAPDAPGCGDRLPGCTGYQSACWLNDASFSTDQAAICLPGTNCYDGSYFLEDMAQANTCYDLSPPPDLSGTD